MLGARGALRIDYVGTRAVHEPYQVQLNGYQTVCDGCFAPFAYKQPLDQRFGNVNEFRTDAGSNYTGLQTSATKQFGGLTLRGNYTYSHCLDEVSNGGLLPFSSLGILYPLPGDLRKEYGNCDYDVRHNLSAFGIYEIPFHSSNALLRYMLSGWQVSQTAFLHSGVPFSVVSAPYTANNDGVFQGSGPQYANRVPGVPLYRKSPVSGVTQTWQPSVAQPGRLCLRCRSQHRCLCRRRFDRHLPIWKFRPQQLPWTSFHLFRTLRDQENQDHGARHASVSIRNSSTSSTTPTFLSPPIKRVLRASQLRKQALAR